MIIVRFVWVCSVWTLLNDESVWWSGDQRHRAGLPPASSPRMPCVSAPAHAGLLAEGAIVPSAFLRHRLRAGQTDPKPGLAQDHRTHPGRVSTSTQTRVCMSVCDRKCLGGKLKWKLITFTAASCTFHSDPSAHTNMFLEFKCRTCDL